ncbi:MAG: DUF3775 domain-containing protein, partial [Gammaproteobacteria bacterium]|nr:DUF3775 domain-containing protein [Gammaproteobacteria bacterium]
MDYLTKAKVEEVIDYADGKELDSLVGAMIRMSPEELSELKALVWLGKDAQSPKHWDALVIQAKHQLDDQTVRFLAEQPALAV